MNKVLIWFLSVAIEINLFPYLGQVTASQFVKTIFPAGLIVFVLISSARSLV